MDRRDFLKLIPLVGLTSDVLCKPPEDIHFESGGTIRLIPMLDCSADFLTPSLCFRHTKEIIARVNKSHVKSPSMNAETILFSGCKWDSTWTPSEGVALRVVSTIRWRQLMDGTILNWNKFYDTRKRDFVRMGQAGKSFPYKTADFSFMSDAKLVDSSWAISSLCVPV